MTLPKPGPLLGVVEFLAKTCYKVDPEKECDRFDLLYRRALDEWFPNPFPFGDGNGPDDDDPFSGPGGSSEAPETVWSRRRGAAHGRRAGMESPRAAGSSGRRR